MATKEQIRDLIKAKIEGQGSNVDAGSALPTILNGIVDLIPSLEDAGITFGGIVVDGDTIPTTPNRFYLTTDYGEFTFGEETIALDDPGFLYAIIVDKEGGYSIESSMMYGVEEVEEDNGSPVSSGAVFNAINGLGKVQVINSEESSFEGDYPQGVIRFVDNGTDRGLFSAVPWTVLKTMGADIEQDVDMFVADYEIELFYCYVSEAGYSGVSASGPDNLKYLVVGIDSDGDCYCYYKAI